MRTPYYCPVQHGRIAALGSHHPLETPKVLIQKMLVPVRLFVRPMPGCGGDTRQGQFLRPLLVAAEDSLAHVTAQTEPTNNPGKSPEKAGGRVCVCSDHRHAAHSDFMDNPQILQSMLLDTLHILALLHVLTLTTSVDYYLLY